MLSKIILIILFIPFFFSLPSPIHAQKKDWQSSPECVAGPNNDVATIRGITCLVKNILKPIPALIALTAVIIIFVAAIKIMSAGADPKMIASGWQTLQWAVIGIILLAGVWLILLTIEKFTGATVTQFGFPDS